MLLNGLLINPDDRDEMFLRNVGLLLTVCKALYHRRYTPSSYGLFVKHCRLSLRNITSSSIPPIVAIISEERDYTATASVTIASK
jgi:hypothetical protein